MCFKFAKLWHNKKAIIPRKQMQLWLRFSYVQFPTLAATTPTTHFAFVPCMIFWPIGIHVLLHFSLPKIIINKIVGCNLNTGTTRINSKYLPTATDLGLRLLHLLSLPGQPFVTIDLNKNGQQLGILIITDRSGCLRMLKCKCGGDLLLMLLPFARTHTIRQSHDNRIAGCRFPDARSLLPVHLKQFQPFPYCKLFY